ncbi:hypothetical protein HYV50_05015 [Candidatus Pacearchaeota archaeon]|nr:hypothetical protein [Candidatus Pacearchaeota archaeon]
MNLQFKLGEEYVEADFASAGFRRKRLVEEIAHNDCIFSHEKGNEIYVVRETPDRKMVPWAYHNLETGEVVQADNNKR